MMARGGGGGDDDEGNSFSNSENTDEIQYDTKALLNSIKYQIYAYEWCEGHKLQNVKPSMNFSNKNLFHYIIEGIL